MQPAQTDATQNKRRESSISPEKADTVSLENTDSVVPVPFTVPEGLTFNLGIDKTTPGWLNALHSRVYKKSQNFFKRGGVSPDVANARASSLWQKIKPTVKGDFTWED